MKNKKIILLSVILSLLLISLIIVVVASGKGDENFSYATEIEKITGDDVETYEGNIKKNEDGFSDEKEEIRETGDNSVLDKLEGFLTKEVIPLFSGVLTALMTVLALIIPYIKTRSKLKSTEMAYSTVYNEHEKLISLAKEFDSTSAKEEVIEAVSENFSKRFSKYDNALSAVLGNCEVLSAQISSLLEGAKLAWKEAEGASLALSKSPTATALKKQSLAVEFLKTYIAKELNIKREELDKKIDEELLK